MAKYLGRIEINGEDLEPTIKINQEDLKELENHTIVITEEDLYDLNGPKIKTCNQNLPFQGLDPKGLSELVKRMMKEE
jgi:hypothetical protein